jgi:hypothetical protein
MEIRDGFASGGESGFISGTGIRNRGWGFGIRDLDLQDSGLWWGIMIKDLIVLRIQDSGFRILENWIQFGMIPKEIFFFENCSLQVVRNSYLKLASRLCGCKRIISSNTIIYLS